MTEVQEENPVATSGREVLVRTFAVESQSLDGRNLHVRVVPFDEVATVADPPDFKPYQEQFMPGVFDRNEKAPNRIRLRTDHNAINDRTGERRPGVTGIVGRGVSLREANGGYEAEFRFLDTAEADTARALVADGGYDGVSAEFVPIRTQRSKAGIMQRMKAHLDSVALAIGPAYSKAEILALREEVIVDEELVPPPVNQDLLDRCQALGIDLPDGMAVLLTRAYTEAAWDGSASRWATAEEYCSAAAIDLNPAGAKKIKDRCHLPFKEPGSGTINVNGVRAALSRIGQGFPNDASDAQRTSAKARLEKLLASFQSSDNSTPAQ
jgi:HK97 family phage prohead protease